MNVNTVGKMKTNCLSVKDFHCGVQHGNIFRVSTVNSFVAWSSRGKHFIFSLFPSNLIFFPFFFSPLIWLLMHVYFKNFLLLSL